MDVDDLQKVPCKSKPLRLACKNSDLLSYLASQAGKPSRQRWIFQQVWGPGYGEERNSRRLSVDDWAEEIQHDPAQPAHILAKLCTVGYVHPSRGLLSG